MVQAVEQAQHFFCGFRVKPCGRLVRQYDVRPCDDGARDCHALLLSARKLVGPMGDAAGQADACQRLFGALQPLGARYPLQGERQCDIFQRGHAGQQAKALKDKTNLLAAQPGQRPWRQAGNIRPAEQILPAGQCVQQAENVHERTFARTGRARDGYIVAGRDMQVDVPQCGNAAVMIYFTRMDEL